MKSRIQNIKSVIFRKSSLTRIISFIMSIITSILSMIGSIKNGLICLIFIVQVYLNISKKYFNSYYVNLVLQNIKKSHKKYLYVWVYRIETTYTILIKQHLTKGFSIPQYYDNILFEYYSFIFYDVFISLNIFKIIYFYF